MVLVTHDAALAFSIADSFLVLRQGRVGAHCDASELLRAPTDPFSARFVGFENVYDLSSLSESPAGSLRAWLRGHAASEGVAFTSPSMGSGSGVGPQWEGVVRSARPSPQGLTVEVVTDDLLVTLRVPPPVTPPLPALGERIRFTIDPATLQPLGAGRPGSPGA